MAAQSGQGSTRRSRAFYAALRRELIAAVEREFELAARQADGLTLREHLQAAADRGHQDERLNPPPIPPEARGLFESFFVLSAARRSGFSASPLTFSDVEAWARLSGVRLTPWELETLLAMDSAALTAAHRNSK